MVTVTATVCPVETLIGAPGKLVLLVKDAGSDAIWQLETEGGQLIPAITVATVDICPFCVAATLPDSVRPVKDGKVPSAATERLHETPGPAKEVQAVTGCSMAHAPTVAGVFETHGELAGGGDKLFKPDGPTSSIAQNVGATGAVHWPVSSALR
jgi:hypothetical protein